MRILHVITSLRTGGAEKLMVDLLPRFQELGNEVELVVFDGIRTAFYEQLEKKGIKINALNVGKNVYHPSNLIKLIPFLRKYDIIHTHNTAPQLFAAIGSCLVGKARLFTTEHNTSNRRRSIPGFKWIDKWMYKQYEKIICISDQAEENLRNYLHDKTPKITTIYNGVDVMKYMEAEPVSAIRSEYPACYLGIMVAGFREQKDQKTLIRAYQMLPQNHHLLLVGSGVTEDECKTLVRELGLSERVHFLGLRNDIPQLLHTADVIIMSSHYEGLSLSSIEGMACGKPFIASDVDGLREIVQGAGILFKHEDADNLADEIKKVSTNPSYEKKIVSLCQEKAKTFDISTMVKNYNELYNK